MQCLLPAFQLSTRTVSKQLNTCSSLRTLSSSILALTKSSRILVKSLPHAALSENGTGSSSYFFAPDKSNPSHHCSDFTLVLKPFPRHLTDSKGEVNHTKLSPHWLSTPIHPSTHERRHLRTSLSSLLPCPPSSSLSSSSITPEKQEDQAEGERWEASDLPANNGRGDRDSRPILRVFVLSTKKRIHKQAVIRHRTRTRLISALRTAIVELENKGWDVETMLGVKSNALMIIPSAWAYSNHMLKLVDQMGIALRSVSAAANKSRSGIGIADPSSRRSALRQRNDPNGSGLNRSSSRSFGKRGKDDMQSNPKVYIQPQRRWE